MRDRKPKPGLPHRQTAKLIRALRAGDLDASRGLLAPAIPGAPTLPGSPDPSLLDALYGERR